MNNTKIAEIYSVHHLNDKEMTDIKNILTKKFSSNFVIKNIIDQSLISGIKILFENKIIDISLSGILKYYQNCLIKEN